MFIIGLGVYRDTQNHYAGEHAHFLVYRDAQHRHTLWHGHYQGLDVYRDNLYNYTVKSVLYEGVGENGD